MNDEGSDENPLEPLFQRSRFARARGLLSCHARVVKRKVKEKQVNSNSREKEEDLATPSKSYTSQGVVE